jgi:glycerol uptake facilitator-like aquaporin
MIMVLTFAQKEIAMDASLLRKWIVEFIGTFFLVYVVGCASLQDARQCAMES